MDMHNIVSKLVTYSTLGLVRDKSKKQKDYKRGLSPTSIDSDNSNNYNNNNSSCWPSKQQQQQMQLQLQNFHIPDTINRAEVKRSGNLEKISALQALRGAANSHHYYRTGNTLNQVNQLPQLYSPDVILRHGSISLSEDYILAEGLLRTVCIS